MKIRLPSILAAFLTLAVLFLGVWVPPTVCAQTNEPPEELEVTWRISGSANHSWASESAREDGTVYARYDGNDSFSLNLAGTTVLTNVSNQWDDTPDFEPLADNNEYSRTCQGGGTNTNWYLNELTKWTPEEGYKTKNFQSTRVENWQYRWPAIGHPEADDTPIYRLELIPPASPEEPYRYRMFFEPFFFIDYDTADEYFETTGTYRISGSDWEGGYSESGELGDHAGNNAPSLANHAWHHRIETHPDGSSLTGELTYSDGKWRDQRTVEHTYRDEDGQSTIEITYEINRKPGIKAIQPNQALGRYTYQDEENYQPATHFVAGKDTVIQVFLPDELKPDQATGLELDVYCNGSKVATLTGPKKDSKHNALIFVPKDKATCGNWAPGTYRFVARLEEREKTLDGVEFEIRRDMRILAVPVKANYNGTIKDPGANWTNADQFLRRVFPLADENVKFELGAPMDASESRYNLATKDGCTWLWLKLRDLQPPRYAGGQYDAIVGFIPEPIPIYTDGELTGYQLGFTVRKPAAIVALGNRDYQTTLAHEIAHFYEVGDEYAGGAFNPAVNPPPGGYTGKDWHTGAPVPSSPGTVKPATIGSGSLISEKLHPYEVGGRGLLGDLISFMGSGAPPSKNWVTPDIWKHLFGVFAPPAAAQGFRLLSSAPANLAVKASGLINAAGEVETLPWFSFTAGTPVTPQTGSHQIVALDASGAVLATQGFTPDTRGLTNPPQVLAHQVFSVEVPLPAGTSRLEIREGDRVLKEIPVSAGSPTITITQPAAGAGLTGTVTLAWTASDPDGDTLSFKVEYSPDGSRWIVLEPATALTEFTADFSRLPGGDQPAIRVTATDGINSTAAVSTGFVSPVKDPAVFIDTPGDGYYLFAGEGVSLEGRAYDPQTGWIYAADHLVWHSDRDGELGRGSLVYAGQLSSGPHVITLTATGPAGQTVTKSLNVTVNPAGSGIPQDVGEQADVPLDHTWTVTFNSPVEPATLTPANIRVLDAAGNPAGINVVPGVDGKSALISPPPGGYLPGQSYIIIVGEGVKSATGTRLRSAYLKRFRT